MKNAKPKMLSVDSDRHRKLEDAARKRRKATGDNVSWGSIAREAIDKYLGGG